MTAASIASAKGYNLAANAMRSNNYKRASKKHQPVLLSPVSLCLLLGALLVSGCEGDVGADGDSNDSAAVAAKIEISGAILIPGGTVTTQNPIGLQGAANRPVSLYRVDDEGNIVSLVLDTDTSDQTGNYILLLPANIPYSSDLIVEAGLGVDTQGDPVLARAIVIDETTDVTPITEYITQKLIDDPTLDLSALPLEEVTELIMFVESLPLGPQPDLTTLLVEIAGFSDLAVEAQINDLATANPQVRLSGLLSVPGPAPRIAARSVPIANQVLELYRIDNAGNNIQPPIPTTPPIVITDSAGAFSFLLDPGESLSADLRFQAIVGGEIFWALATDELLNINAETTFISTRLINEPGVDFATLDVDEVSGIVDFAQSSNCADGAVNLADALIDCETQVGPEVDILVSNAVNQDPTVANPIPDQVATEDVAFSFQFAVNTFDDGDGDTLTYTSDATGWLSFDPATRTFSGTPLSTDVGTTPVTVTADDGNGGTIDDTFDIVISNAPVGGAVWNNFNWDDGSTWQ